MKTQYKLYTNVQTFYTTMAGELKDAEERISMMYYTYDHGKWALELSQVLCEKAASGVDVRLMVDGFGLVLDEPRHTLLNQQLLKQMAASGVKVEIFQPQGWRLNAINRLHIKICAIDEHTAFIGGSNIGDHYTGWDDYNLRVQGELGNNFHQVYDYIHTFTPQGADQPGPNMRFSDLFAGQAQVWLTVPRQRSDIRRALLKVILEAEQEIYLRYWYFLPDKEILNALRAQARRGVKVNVLFSHQTRVRPIDWANYIHAHKLAKAGGRVFRYTGGYMHAKVAWNEKGQVLFGSANLENKAMHDTFECSLAIEDHSLARLLTREFELDTERSFQQTSAVFPQRSLSLKAFSYACNLASPWL
jgi:cardiolipin synthase